MHKGRLEAFSDAVIAIIITIMVLELKVPHGAELSDLRPLAPIFVSYLISFIYLGIYWNNHHHLLQATQKISGGALWANSHLLFWLSLIPFTTAWLGEHEFSQWPAVLYGVNLILCGIAYFILARQLVAKSQDNITLAAAIGKDLKGIVSVVIYAIAIGLAFINPLLAYAGYISVAVLWLLPDRRIEKAISK